METRHVKYSLLEPTQNIMKTIPPRYPPPVESAAQSAAAPVYPVYTPGTEQTFIRAKSAPASAVSAFNRGLYAALDSMSGREHCQLPAALSPRPAARSPAPTLQRPHTAVPVWGMGRQDTRSRGRSRRESSPEVRWYSIL